MLKIILYSILLFEVHSLNQEFFTHKDKQGRVFRRPIRSTLLGWHKYIRDFAQEYVYEIEDYGLCNFQLADFTQNISRNFFGYEVIGLIKYTNGFIGSLQNINLQDQAEQSFIDEISQTSKLQTKLIFNDLMLYFDYEANLTKTYFTGTVGIPIESIDFTIEIVKDYKINKIEGRVFDIYAKIPYKNMRWYYEPSNPYTEIIDRDVQWNLFDDLQRLANTTMKKLLTNVIKKSSYPQICLDCNDKMQIFEYTLKEQEDY